MGANGPKNRPNAAASNDHRPNSGLREGDISHAEVNAELRRLTKTVLFGQQERLRNGLLREDGVLPRFHAGHPLVLFFYRGLHRLPPYLIDALLANGISATLVGGKDLLIYQDVTTYARSNERRLADDSGQDLLVFKDIRNHQAFHIGFTRKTIYIPEGFLREGINQGYASWAISQVLIREGWPLLDYLLILEFVRRAQRRLRARPTLGRSRVIRNVLCFLNTHLAESDGSEDSEFSAFFRHYCNAFLALDRRILGKDPYDLADRIFDEPQERAWADVKLDQIAIAYKYPASFHVNRDIVHHMATQAARIHRLPLAPRTTEDTLHDLRDAADFRLFRQSKTAPLLDQLLEEGEPGISSFIDAVAEENAGGHHYITLDLHDDYDTVDVFKSKLQTLSSTPEDTPESICTDFRDLLKYRTLRKLHTLVEKFTALPGGQQRSDLSYLKHLLSRIVRYANPDYPEIRAELETAVARAKRIRTLLDMADQHLGSETPLLEQDTLINLLKKLDRHPDYHTTILDQVRRLVGNARLLFGTSRRHQLDTLHRLIPDRSYRLSSDPQGLRTCLHRFETQRRVDPDSQELFTHLAGIFIRLDRAEDYPGYVEKIRTIGPEARPALQAVLDRTGRNNPSRKTIRQTAESLLHALASERMQEDDRALVRSAGRAGTPETAGKTGGETRH